MGLLDTVKGWFNIGGVKVKLQDVNTRVPKMGNRLTGKVQLTSKGDKEVLKLRYKILFVKTTGSGDNKETEEKVLAQSTFDTPFEMKKGETKTMDFGIDYSYEKSLKDMGGVLGAVGKVGSFLSSEKNEYFVVAECDVKGTALDPSDRVAVTFVD